jgi:hypothetical protein
MMDVLRNIPSWAFPLLFLIANVFIRPIGVFRRLKGQYFRGDPALRMAVFAKYTFPYLAMLLAFGGLFASLGVSNTIWGWVVGFGGLFLAGGLLTLQHVGPFYLLISDLDDLEDRIRRLSETNPTQQGT